MIRLAPFAFVFCLLTGADDAKDSPAEKEQAKLQGTWTVVATTFDGKELSKQEIEGRKILFRGNEFTSVNPEKGKKTLTYSLDPGKEPKQIDLTLPAKDQKAYGIYSLDADDLKICYGEPGKDRPKRFESPKASRVFLLVLKREMN